MMRITDTVMVEVEGKASDVEDFIRWLAERDITPISTSKLHGKEGTLHAGLKLYRAIFDIRHKEALSQYVLVER